MDEAEVHKMLEAMEVPPFKKIGILVSDVDIDVAPTQRPWTQTEIDDHAEVARQTDSSTLQKDMKEFRMGFNKIVPLW